MKNQGTTQKTGATLVFLPPEDLMRLKICAAKQGRTMKDIVAEAVLSWLEKNQ